MPGGNHPPRAQIQSGPGCTVVHAVLGVELIRGSPPGGVMPGGNHPPLAQIHSGPGWMVVHPPDCAEDLSA